MKRKSSSASNDHLAQKKNKSNASTPDPVSTSNPSQFAMDSDIDMYDQDGDEEVWQDDDEELEGASENEVMASADGKAEGKKKEPTPPPSKPRLTAEQKGKLSPRKRYLADAEELLDRFGGKTGDLIKNVKKSEDQLLSLSLCHSSSPRRGIPINFLIDEVSSYPTSHSFMAFAEDDVPPEVAVALQEVGDLKPSRTLQEVIGWLIGTVDPTKKELAEKEGLPFRPQVRKVPSSSAAGGLGGSTKHHKMAIGSEDDDDEDDDDDDDEDDDGYDATDYEDDALFGIGGGVGPITQDMKKVLHRDFVQISAAGYFPGFTRVSELDNVISVSVPVGRLRVPLRALQAWDSRLISDKHVYLVMLVNTGPRYPIDMDNNTNARFVIGLSRKYKPSKETVASAFRSHSSIDSYTAGEFEPFSLSTPFHSLFARFTEILHYRQALKLGWAGAEDYCLQPGEKTKVDKTAASKLDKEENDLKERYQLPNDPLAKGDTSNNYPLAAFCYLVRRFVMCPRFCLVCHRKIESEIVALKPYICSSELCLFQFMALGLGPSVEYEIKTNPSCVDLLIQLAYSAAREGELRDFPNGLDLRVPTSVKPVHSAPTRNYYQTSGQQELEQDRQGPPPVVHKDAKGTEYYEFDFLNGEMKRGAVVSLLSELPPVTEMKAWLTGHGLTADEMKLAKTRKLTDMKDGKIPVSAVNLLRWIVASNTSYLVQIEDDDEKIQGVPKNYTQFKFIVGSPDKEHLLQKNIQAVQQKNSHANQYPTLFAFHGSGLRNWHSILREGLHFKKTLNGRAYGHGVYFALDGGISASSYAQAGTGAWKSADNPIGRIFALCEIVNSPNEFVSQNPYFVVDKVEWIQTRYLLVQTTNTSWPGGSNGEATDEAEVEPAKPLAVVPMDPKFKISLNQVPIQVPDTLPKLKKLTAQLSSTFGDAATESDTEILASDGESDGGGGHVSESDNEDDFEPASDELLAMIKLLPPPKNASLVSTSTLQKEVKTIMKAQARKSANKLGFYFEPSRSNDNLFQWVIELMGFDPALPIAKDMKTRGIRSVLMEVRFTESFPFSPPFFRIIHPRFLPFAHGGGGHVTAGGSLCMDLLTSQGWSSVYTIEAILLQIRMAISNLEPRPARLDTHNWNQPYNIGEAVDGYIRACNTHGWTVPEEIKKMGRGGI